jgi:hypothetical protein
MRAVAGILEKTKRGLDWLQHGYLLVQIFTSIGLGKALQAVLVMYTHIPPVWITPLWWLASAFVCALLVLLGNRLHKRDGQRSVLSQPERPGSLEASPGESESTVAPASDSNDIQVEATREEWWNSNIKSVIRDSEELVVMDSALGHKGPFWEALSTRLVSPKPFHLVYLRLKDGDPFLARCLKVAVADATLTRQDKTAIDALVKAKSNSPYSSNKNLEFYFWEGISPGPLVAWTINSKETIGLGFWMNLSKATDGTPYVIVKRGPLFDDLKQHYKSFIDKAQPKSR